MSATTHVVALSGGKDSTAMALRLAEVEPRPYVYLITPTGDELPEMVTHWQTLEHLLGTPLTRVTEQTLNGLIDHYRALPNWRQRWCTRQIKIVPCLRFLKEHQPALLYVGLRADEEERRGIYSEDVETRFPLREWGWGINEVRAYLRARGVRVPARTDCARCYGQRVGEWRRLLEKHPEIYADAEDQERRVGHTFRSPARDSLPTSLEGLRKHFQANPTLPLFDDDEEDEYFASCRVCRI